MVEKAKASKTTSPRTPRKKQAGEVPAAPKRPARKKALASGSPMPSEERTRLIREAAYRRAEQRGFQGGSPEEDWYEAEREVEERLRGRKGTGTI